MTLLLVKSGFARRAFAGAAVLSALVSMGGCASEGIEVEGALLDAVGLSSSALNATGREPKIQDRATLVVPPTLQALPAPTDDATIAANLGSQFPQDPEQVAASQAALRKAEIRKMCDDREWAKRTKPDEFNRLTNNGRACGSLLDMFEIGGAKIETKKGTTF